MGKIRTNWHAQERIKALDEKWRGSPIKRRLDPLGQAARLVTLTKQV